MHSLPVSEHITHIMIRVYVCVNVCVRQSTYTHEIFDLLLLFVGDLVTHQFDTVTPM